MTLTQNLLGTMLNILIIDDNDSFRKSFRDLLSQHLPAMCIEEAANTKRSLKKIGEHPPDLMFVDLELAGESGLDLARMIRSIHGDTTIAILTNYDLPEYREAAKNSGADFFFSKGGSSMEEVLSLVDSIVFEKQRRGDLRIP
jgi:DNA-binding NarL/FixJ family response regulator